MDPITALNQSITAAPQRKDKTVFMLPRIPPLCGNLQSGNTLDAPAFVPHSRDYGLESGDKKLQTVSIRSGTVSTRSVETYRRNSSYRINKMNKLASRIGPLRSPYILSELLLSAIAQTDYLELAGTSVGFGQRPCKEPSGALAITISPLGFSSGLGGGGAW